MLAECKFHKDPIQKEQIREYIGVLKDIQENYFVADDDTIPLQAPRYTEIGVFFSASGFTDEAVRLAFAHNIKTISYENISLIENITKAIYEIEKNFLSISTISAGNQVDFMGLFRQIIFNNNDNTSLHITEFINRFNPSNGFDEVATALKNSIYEIKSSFLANTSGGAFIHFLSNNNFPDSLFSETDIQNVKIHFEVIKEQRYFYMTFSNDNTYNRFYLRPPESLSYAAFTSPVERLREKNRLFNTIHVSKQINGINRNLILRLDQSWLSEEFENLLTTA